jgi:hypothetical protein
MLLKLLSSSCSRPAPTTASLTLLTPPIVGATQVTPGSNTALNVPGVTGNALVANTLCCNPADACVSGRCCTPPSLPCTSDAQCCPFSAERRGAFSVPRSGLCMSVRSNVGRDLINSAIFDAFAPAQMSGCLNPACGTLGQPCCPSVLGVGPQCAGSLTCDTRNNTCQQPCDRCRRCPLSSQGFVEPCTGPGNGFCAPWPACGGRGQPCCARTATNDGCQRNGAAPSQCGVTERPMSCPATMTSWTCGSCGLVGESCCRDASNRPSLCAPGGVCDTSNPRPGGLCIRGGLCGGVGQACCTGDMLACNGDPTQVTCIGTTCQLCGGAVQPCCGPIGRPSSCRSTLTGGSFACAGTATGERCFACGGTGQPCCISDNPTPGGLPIESCGAPNTCQTNSSGARVCVQGG